MMYRKQCFSLVVVLCVSFTFVKAMEIEKKNLFIPKSLGNISVHYSGEGFSVKKNDKVSLVPSWFLDKQLRGISQDTLTRVLAAGVYLSVNVAGEDEYSLRFNVRAGSGNPIIIKN